MMRSILFFAALALPLLVKSAPQSSTRPGKPPVHVAPPTKFGIVVYPAFTALDVFGPLDIFNAMSMGTSLNLSILSTTLDPVSTHHEMEGITGNFGEAIVPTHTFANAPSDIEVLFVPGGPATLFEGPHLDEHVAFIKRVYPKLRYLITVCTGSALVARTGILDGLRATSNKQVWSWAVKQGPKVKWVAKARWVHDRNIWTTSGVSAGIDGTFDFVRTVYGKEKALEIANGLEYEQQFDWRNDPFADLYNATDVFPAQ